MPNSTQCGVVVLFLQQTQCFFSYNLDAMHYSLLHFHFTSAYTHRVISHVLKSKRLTNC